MNRLALTLLLVTIFIVTGTVIAILYANGYRIIPGGTGTGNIKFIDGTGLMVATSRPDGARVLINGHLTTATNNTINLTPGEYKVEIEKDGYVTWKKTIILNKGLVSEANALLVPTAPKFEAATTIGIGKIVMDPTQTILAYTVASSSAEKNGIYSLDMSASPLIFLSDTGTQLTNDLSQDYSNADLSFSPNGKQIMAHLPNGSYFLFDARSGKQTPQDVTNTLLAVERDWDQQSVERVKKLNNSLPTRLIPIVNSYFKNPLPSPDGDKILYTASVSGTITQVVVPAAPSVNSTPDQRTVKAGTKYVYDIKEDKNYAVGSGTNEYFWHADDRHLVFAEKGKVNVVEFDGGNLTNVYDGPFVDNLVFPWPDGSSIAIVAKLSSSLPFNLYRIGLQ